MDDDAAKRPDQATRAPKDVLNHDFGPQDAALNQRMLSLTQLLAAAACFACLLIAAHIARQRGAQRPPSYLLAAFFALMGAQLGLLAMASEASMAMLTRLRALLALTVPSVGYVFILSLRGPLHRSVWLHLSPLAAGLAVLAFRAADALDYLILVATVGYALALARLMPAGAGQFAAIAPNQAHGFAWLISLAALFAGIALIDGSLLAMHRDGVELRESPLLSLGILAVGGFAAYVILGSLNRPSMMDWLHAHARYESSTLAPTARAALAARIAEALDDATTLTDQSLTVLRLSRRLGVPARHVTEAINLEMNRSFSDLLNERRIALAQNLLADEPHTTIVDICHRVGYASKSNFNREFRKRTGQTPSAFRGGAATS